jgi:hypothetical protein
MRRYPKVRCTFKMELGTAAWDRPVDQVVLASRVRKLSGAQATGLPPGPVAEFLGSLADAIERANGELRFEVNLPAEDADAIRRNAEVMADVESNYHVGRTMTDEELREHREASYALLQFRRCWISSTGWDATKQEVDVTNTARPALGSGYRR